jgi:cyanophycinase
MKHSIFADPMRPCRSGFRFLCALLLLFLCLLCSSGAGKASEPNISGSAFRAGVRKGTLFLAGGGSLPDPAHQRFLELAGGSKGKLVVIPTAHGKADRLEQLKGYTWWKSQPLGSVVFLHTRNRDQANDPDFVKPLAEATAVWMSGGDQSLLTAAYRGTAVEREMHKLLDRGGVVGGTSAGAAVMSAVMITGGNPHAQVGEGFGLLSGIVVDQHFQNRNRKDRLLDVLEKNPEYLGLGIDEETAVIVNECHFTVMGKQNVHFYAPARKQGAARFQLLQSGAHADFRKLCEGLDR